MAQPFDRTYDNQMLLTAGTTVATATSGVSSPVDLATVALATTANGMILGHAQFDIVINVTAQDVSATDDSCLFSLELSNDNFVSDIAPGVAYAIGHKTGINTITGGTFNIDKGIGVHMVPAHNLAAAPSGQQKAYRYARLRHKTTGATVATTYSAYISPRN